MDSRVQEVQIWLGDTFPSYFYYDENGQNSGSFPIEPDGMTGNTTVKALIMALQIHLNLKPDGLWGNGTSSACPTINDSTNNVTLVKILQGGFICKGYNPGPFDGVMGTSTKSAIKSFKADLGFTNGTETMEASYFKSLLTTDPTIVTNTTDGYIRIAQQYLNANYSNLYLSSLGFIPTSGHFERKTSKALIYAFQSIINTTPDGALGPNTFNKMPSISVGNSNVALIKLLQCALTCNQFHVNNINGVYDQHVASKVTEFQRFMCLDIDSLVTLSAVNRRTWGALLWSKGDMDRAANAADTRYQLTAVQAQSLYNDGIRYIGRYLTKVSGGFDKNLTEQEISNIQNTGLKIFPLFQENNASATDFTYRTGYDSWNKAVKAATKLRIPSCTIYFCVDFDATEAQAKGTVKQYFQGINDAKKANSSIYKVGIYSARNTCSVICSANLAVNSFVSNMSTGYSGNLGFLMPENWSFDQYATGSYIASDGSRIDLDRVIASGRDLGVETIGEIGDDEWDLHTLNWDDIERAKNEAVLFHTVIPIVSRLEDVYWECFPNADAESCVLSVLYYLWHKKYTDLEFNVTLVSNPIFADYMTANHPNLAAELEPYIKKTGYIILKDSSGRLIELHHLAAVISAYLNPPVLIPAEWYGWAGDMATAIKEIKILKDNLEPRGEYLGDIRHARDRIGRMEVGDDVQMNYCDIFGDADGFAIHTLIRAILSKSLKEHVLTGSFYQYYADEHTNRMTYLLNNMGAGSYSIVEVTDYLYYYFINPKQDLLMRTKAGIEGEGILANWTIIKACCQAFVEFIIHDWKNY